MLLKDNSREIARKARVEARRKAEAPPTRNMDLSLDSSDSFEIRKRKREDLHDDTSQRSSPTLLKAGSEDSLMDDEAREVLLGKESAEAVGKILEKDRKTRVVPEALEDGWFRFWSRSDSRADIVSGLAVLCRDVDLDLGQAGNDVIDPPQIEGVAEGNAIVAVLRRFLEDQGTRMCFWGSEYPFEPPQRLSKSICPN
jgi:hypothetical protein